MIRTRVPLDPLIESSIVNIVLSMLLIWSVIQIGSALYSDWKCECPCLEPVK